MACLQPCVFKSRVSCVSKLSKHNANRLPNEMKRKKRIKLLFIGAIKHHKQTNKNAAIQVVTTLGRSPCHLQQPVSKAALTTSTCLRPRYDHSTTNLTTQLGRNCTALHLFRHCCLIKSDPFPGAQDGQNLISLRWSLPSPTDPVW